MKPGEVHRALVVSAFLLIIPGCATSIPKQALQLSPESLQNRQMQTRRFQTVDEAKVLSACAGVMQDLGFNLDESETKLGVVVGSKTREAVSAGQVAGAVVLAVLTGAVAAVDKDQVIRAALVTRPVGKERKPGIAISDVESTTGEIAVRVTFQRMIFNTQNLVTKAEQINDAQVYQEFFDKLSQSLFLEANEI